MKFKCPFCKLKFDLLGGAKDTSWGSNHWENTLFFHLYWTHEGDLQNDK